MYFCLLACRLSTALWRSAVWLYAERGGYDRSGGANKVPECQRQTGAPLHNSGSCSNRMYNIIVAVVVSEQRRDAAPFANCACFGRWPQWE